MTIEAKLRDLLDSKADEFELPAAMPTTVVRQARRRAHARVALAAAPVVSVAVAVVAAVALTGSSEPERFVAMTVAARSDPAEPDIHDDAGAEISETDLQNNLECMRAHGFALPDPITTDGGWSVLLDELPPDTQAWRQAVFVDCRLLDIGSELVLGGRSGDEIDRLMSCASSHGAVLPEPNRSGDHYVFPLDPSDPHTDDWYRTVFVTCAP
jgi:hypothetical protein